MADSKTAIALLNRIVELRALEVRTLQQSAWLLNAELKAETRRLSHVYEYLKAVHKQPKVNIHISTTMGEVLGKAKFPEYGDFVKLVTNDGAKSKSFWSLFEGIMCLVKLNKKAILADKLARQGGKFVKAEAKVAAQASPENAANTAAIVEANEKAKAQRAEAKAHRAARKAAKAS